MRTLFLTLLDDKRNYDINGNKLSGDSLPPGIYLVNGKKTLIK